MNYSPDITIRQGQRRRFEAMAVVLLSLATVGSAWCSYRASTWSTRSSKLALQSSSQQADAAALRIKANQMFTLDVYVFGEYAKAHSASNEPLARFYAGKFRPELQAAFDAWRRTQPFENPDAPPHPFVTNLYQPRQLVEADRVAAESRQLWTESTTAAEVAHRYILISVLLAFALFFAGTAPQFETYKARRLVLALGLVALLTASGMLLRLRVAAGTERPFSPEIPPALAP